MAKLYLGTREITPITQSEQIGIPRAISSTGVYEFPPNGYIFKLPDRVTDIGEGVLKEAFSYNRKIGGIDFSSLTHTTNDNCCYSMAYGSSVKSANLSNLVSVMGESAFSVAFSESDLESLDLSSLEIVGDGPNWYGPFQSAFSYTKLTSIDLHSLREIGEHGMSDAFYDCEYLTSADLSSLETVKTGGMSSFFENCDLRTVNLPLVSYVGISAFSYCFHSNVNLTDIYFNSLTTSSFAGNDSLRNMFNSSTAITSGNCTVHFPSNLQTVVSGLSGYPLFGGTSGRITLAFDLPATS